MEAFNLQNIITHNGVSISIAGMLIVFSGLLIITVYINLLPKLLDFIDRQLNRKTILRSKETSDVSALPDEIEPPAEIEKPKSDMNEIMSVIGLVLHLEQQRAFRLEGGDELITIARDNRQVSMWKSAGKMRKTPHRRQRAQI